MNFNRLGLRQCKKGGILSSLESSNGIGYYFSLWFWEACCAPLPQETLSRAPPPPPAGGGARAGSLMSDNRVGRNLVLTRLAV